MASLTPTKVYGPKSFNSLCRFCKNPFLHNSSSIPIFSVTQRQECKGVQLPNLLWDYGSFVQDNSSLSNRLCPKCSKRILTSCKTLQEAKQAAQAGPSPKNPSVKRLAKNSPSVGPCLSVGCSNSHRIHSQGRARKKLSLKKANGFFLQFTNSKIRGYSWKSKLLPCPVGNKANTCFFNLVPRVFRLPTRGSGRRNLFLRPLSLVGRRKTLGTRLPWFKYARAVVFFITRSAHLVLHIVWRTMKILIRNRRVSLWKYLKSLFIF